jgi:MFS family permease
MNIPSATPRTVTVLTALIVAEILSTFELTLIFAAMGAMFKEFHDPTVIAWILSSFTLVAASVITICGRLGDMWGRRNVLLVVVALSCVGSIISMLSPDLFGVIAGRTVQGFSSAILPLCFGLVREHLPANKVPMGTGAVIATANITGAAAYVLGGMIVDHFTWHGIFFASAAVAFVAFFTTWKLLPKGKTAPAQGRFDYPGAFLFVPAVFMILFGISRWSSWGLASPALWALIACGALIIAFWARHELRQQHPLINVRLLGDRQVILTNLCLAMLCLGPIQYGMIISMYLQQPTWNIAIGGMTATDASWVVTPSVLLGGIGALLCGPFVRTFGARRTMILAGLLLTMSWITITVIHGSAWLIGTLMIPQSIGMAIVLSVTPVLLNEVVPLERTSEANGLAGLFRQIATAVGAMGVGLILKFGLIAAPNGKGTFPSQDSFTGAIGFVAFASFLCLLSGLSLPRRATRSNLAASAASLR